MEAWEEDTFRQEEGQRRQLKMFVTEFWYGVAAVLIVETLAMLVASACIRTVTEEIKKEHNGEKKKAG